MAANEEKHLLQLIRIVPIVSLIAFVVILNGIIINNSKSNSAASIEALSEQLLSQKKHQLKADLDRIITDIEFDNSSLTEQRQKEIQHRVVEAHDLVKIMHTNNQHLPEGAAKNQILQTLRSMRFDYDKGFYYIFDQQGKLILNAMYPHVEGASIIDSVDTQGNPVIRELIDDINVLGETFHHYQYVSQHDAFFFDTVNLSFLKLYEPFGWIIGSGTTTHSVEQQTRQRALSRLGQFRIDQGSYLFVLNSEGTPLLHPDPSFVGINRYDSLDQEGKPYVQEIIHAALNGSGYVTFDSDHTPAGIEDSEMLAYVTYIPEWDWIIATGLYTYELNQVIRAQEQLLEEQNQSKHDKLTISMLVISLAISVIYLFFAHRINKTFDRFRLRIGRDFNALNDLKDQLAYSATHDSLTKLPNRKSFQETVEYNIKQAQKHNGKLAIMFVDLDDFKNINDLYGHAAGDSLLRQLSRIFLQAVELGDTVSRFGGDEFVFCFANLVDEQHGLQRAMAIFDAVARSSVVLEGTQHKVSLSGGITVFPEHGSSLDSLLSNADIALYKAKERGKNTYHLFNLEILEEQNYQLSLEQKLKKALANDEIYVEYQPQIDLRTGRLYGVEALARWRNPTLGQVPPLVFIHQAEKMGLIDPIGDYIVERSCREVAQYNQQTGQMTRLSINISPNRISDPQFVDSITELVKSNNMKCANVTLEITENVLIKDTQAVQPILHQLKKKGFSIALDDFGTGYSSLRYLNTLPINELKIDRAFVEQLPKDPQSQSLVNAILAMSSSMDLRIVAEGIEDSAQHHWLAQNHCHLGQGYLFDKPLSLDELTSKYPSNVESKVDVNESYSMDLLF